MLLLITKGFIIPERLRSNAIKYLDEAVDELSDNYPPMIRNLRAEQAKLLGTDITKLGYNAKRNPPYNQSFFVACEILVADDYIIVLSLEGEDPGGTRTASLPTVAGISYIGSSLDYEAILSPISGVMESKFDTTVGPLWYINKHFTALCTEAVTGQFNADYLDLASSELLAQASCRSLATEIKRSSSGRKVADIRNRVRLRDVDEINSSASRLVDAGLANSEIIIVCSKSHSQVIRIEHKESLEELDRAGVRCACGRPLSEETAQEILTITEKGRSLLDKSRWMSILLKRRLEVLGVQPDDIQLECTIKDSEVDCVANICGELMIFELKAKEFGLGEAYAFQSKISLLKPQRAVIITTAHVERAVKEHFKNSAEAGRNRTSGRRAASEDAPPIEYIEGVENFSAGIESILSAACERKIRTMLIDALAFLGPAPDSLLERIFKNL